MGHDGNVSLRLGEDQILVTPSGVGKGRLRPEMLVKCTPSGEVLEGDRHPSSETPMHLMVYRERSDVRAVVHAHPPMATAFAVCRRPLRERYLTETISGLGEVPVAPFALPSTQEVPDSIRPFVRDHSAVLLANHGALTWGPDLWSAIDRMETVEQTARIYANVQLLRPFVRDHSAVLLANHGALTWGPDLWSAIDRMETVEQTARIYANVQLLGGGVELTEDQKAALLGLAGRYAVLAGPRTEEESV